MAKRATASLPQRSAGKPSKDVDAGTAGAGGGGEKTTPSVVDLTTKVKLPDGTEVTVADLVESRTLLAEAMEKNKGYEEDMQQVRRLFGSSTTAEDRVSAITHVLKKQGYDDQQIAFYLQATGMTGEGGDEGEEEEEETVVDRKKTAKPSPEVQELLERDKAREGEVRKLRLANLRAKIDSALDKAVDTDPGIQLLLKRTGEWRADPNDPGVAPKAIKEARATVRAQLERQAIEQLQLRRAKTGQNDVEPWITEEVGRAVKPVVDAFQSVIGDVSKVGRSPETVAGGDNPFEGVKPVPPPEYSDEKTVSDMTNDITGWTNDVLARAGAEMAQTAEGQV